MRRTRRFWFVSFDVAIELWQLLQPYDVAWYPRRSRRWFTAGDMRDGWVLETEWRYP